MTETREAIILEELKETIASPQLSKLNERFRTLILTMISQNTVDYNIARASKNLSKHIMITPQALAETDIGELETCLLLGGLYKNKARAIKAVSKIILQRFHDSLQCILSLHLEEARRTLTDMPGVGPKTADVVLLFSANRPIIPVDTHIYRVSRRLGLAPTNGNYEVRMSLQSHYHPKDYLTVHLLLIGLGRTYCRARQSLCKKCSLNINWPSNGLGEKDA